MTLLFNGELTIIRPTLLQITAWEGKMPEDTKKQAESSRYFRDIPLGRKKEQWLNFHILEIFA